MKQLDYLLPKLTIGETKDPEFIIRLLYVKEDNAQSVQREEWGSIFYSIQTK